MKHLTILFLLIVLITVTSSAQIPRTISFQGILTDTLGNPVGDGAWAINFRLFDAETEGNQLWAESKVHQTKRGLFSTILGDVVPFGAAVKFDKPYWLAIQAGGQPEMIPRIPLNAVGYSFNSITADTANYARALAVGSSWDLTGNAGTTAGTNFIGTTDTQALDIRTNNLLRTRITTKGQIETYNTGQSVFVGEGAGANDDLTDNRNVIVGYRAGYSNTTGFHNTANGRNSLYSNTTGNENTANGYHSLFSNISGNGNTANGHRSLYSNTTGDNNTANGLNALYYNISGNGNTASGYGALYSNVAGSSATAIGINAMRYANNTATPFTNYNVAVGFEALRGSTTASANTGNYNTALGYRTLLNNTTGHSNTALGYSTGSNVTSGSNLTLIGFDAEPTSGTATNQITLGNANVTSLRCAVTTITALSDVRDKKNIQELSLGLDFISKLKPRQFNWDKREWYENNVSDGSKMQEAPTAGFIAQELDEVQTTQNTEWLNLVLKDNPEKIEATPGNLFPIMVKAIQELKTENEDLKKRLSEFETVVKLLVEEKKSTENSAKGGCASGTKSLGELRMTND